jgi:single-strand DNA-binding protein
MPNFQKFELSGHLGRDPETRFSAAGNTITSFSVAWSSGKKDDPNRKTTWFNCVAFKDLATFIAENFKKGDAIKITNALVENEVWTDREGKKRDGWKVKVFGAEAYDEKRSTPARSAAIDEEPPF